jgi:methyl-accepting chemotaxis protein
VVAGEVKALTTETERATLDIAARIDELTACSSGAADAIDRIGSTIAEIDEISGHITESLTGERGVARTVDRTRADAQSLLVAAERLAGHAQSLLGEAEHLSGEYRTG